MHIHQNATPPNLATVLCFAQGPLRGAAAIFNHQTSHFDDQRRRLPRTIAMAEAAAAAQGESVCRCNVRIGIWTLQLTYVCESTVLLIRVVLVVTSCSWFLLHADGQKRKLGGQLVDACKRTKWQEAIRLLEKGEWTGADRQRVHEVSNVLLMLPAIGRFCRLLLATSSHSHVANYKFHPSGNSLTLPPSPRKGTVDFTV